MVFTPLSDFLRASFQAFQAGTGLPAIRTALEGVSTSAEALNGVILPLGPRAEVLERLQGLITGDLSGYSERRAAVELVHVLDRDVRSRVAQVLLDSSQSEHHAELRETVFVAPVAEDQIVIDAERLDEVSTAIAGANSIVDIETQLLRAGVVVDIHKGFHEKGVGYLKCLPEPVVKRLRWFGQRASRLVHFEDYRGLPIDLSKQEPVLELDVDALLTFEQWAMNCPGMTLNGALIVYELFGERVKDLGADDRRGLLAVLRRKSSLEVVGTDRGRSIKREELIAALEAGAEIPETSLSGFHALLRPKVRMTSEVRPVAQETPTDRPEAPTTQNHRTMTHGTVICGVPIPDKKAALARADRLRIREAALAGSPETWGLGGGSIEDSFGLLGKARGDMDGLFLGVCRNYEISRGDDPKARSLIEGAIDKYQRSQRMLFEVRYELDALSSKDVLAYWVAMHPQEAARALQSLRSSSVDGQGRPISFVEGPKDFVDRLEELLLRRQELVGLPALRLQDILFFLQQVELRRSLGLLRILDPIQGRFAAAQEVAAEMKKMLDQIEAGQGDKIEMAFQFAQGHLERELIVAQADQVADQIRALQELLMGLGRRSKRYDVLSLQWALRCFQHRAQGLQQEVEHLTSQLGAVEGLLEGEVQTQLDRVTQQREAVTDRGYGLLGQAREDVAIFRILSRLVTEFPSFGDLARFYDGAVPEYQRLDQEWFEVLREIYAINFADPLVYHVVMHPEGVANELRFLGFQLPSGEANEGQLALDFSDAQTTTPSCDAAHST